MCGTTTSELSLTAKEPEGCACCAPQTEAEASSPTDDAVIKDVLVEGLSCGSCAAKVTDALTALDGVHSVEINLVSGGTSTVHIIADPALADPEVNAVIEKAGYRLTTA